MEQYRRGYGGSGEGEEEVDVYWKLGITETIDSVGGEEAGMAGSAGADGMWGGSMSTRPPRIVTVLASFLERMVAKNDVYVVERAAAQQQGIRGGCSMRGYNEHLTVFHGMKAPGIGVGRYVERIHKYAHCSPACFVVAYAYLDRFIHRHPALPITSLNIHRLLITSVMVAAKFLDDAYYNNAYYAKVGGVTTTEMNRLELEFLFTLGFRLQVTTHIFESYCCHLEREFALGGPFQHPYLEKRKLQFSWSFNSTPSPSFKDDATPDCSSSSCDRSIARVCCSTPCISLQLTESVS